MEPVLIGSAGAGGSGGSGGVGGAGGGAGGGSSSTTTTEDPRDPPEGSFPCGDTWCMHATEYCRVDIDGVCCGVSYACAPLPEACAADGAECPCFQDDDCPCSTDPDTCMPQGPGWSCSQNPRLGTFEISCAYP